VQPQHHPALGLCRVLLQRVRDRADVIHTREKHKHVAALATRDLDREKTSAVASLGAKPSTRSPPHHKRYYVLKQTRTEPASRHRIKPCANLRNTKITLGGCIRLNPDFGELHRPGSVLRKKAVTMYSTKKLLACNQWLRYQIMRPFLRI
jgi:hypothetical protein